MKYKRMLDGYVSLEANILMAHTGPAPVLNVNSMPSANTCSRVWFPAAVTAKLESLVVVVVVVVVVVPSSSVQRWPGDQSIAMNYADDDDEDGQDTGICQPCRRRRS